MKCLIPNTHKRLLEAHRLWHQTLDNYFDPEGFRVNLNATIQSLRNLTFALQHEKHVFKNFDEWYENWREKMKNDETMSWLNDSRVKIVHMEDLKTKSIARVTIYQYSEIFKADVEIPIDIPYEVIAIYLKDNDYIKDYHIKNDFVLKINRKWVVDKLPNRELLNTLSYCFGFLNKLVINAHNKLDCDINSCNIKDELHQDKIKVLNSGILSCMDTANEIRTSKISLRKLQKLRYREKIVKEDEEITKKAVEKYDAKKINFSAKDMDIISQAKSFINLSKNILKKDKYHMPMLLLRIPDKGMFPYGGHIPEDRSDKYIFMERVAKKVDELNVDGIISIFESWLSSDYESISKGRPIKNHKDKKECIQVGVITKNGIKKNFITPFKRDENGEIIFDKTIESVGDTFNYMKPILKVWENED